MDKQNLKNLIAKNDFETFFSVSKSLFNNDIERFNDISVLESRWNALIKKIGKGIISDPEENLEMNNIRSLCLELIDKENSENIKLGERNTSSTNSNKKNPYQKLDIFEKILSILVAIITIWLFCQQCHKEPVNSGTEKDSVDSIPKEQDTTKNTQNIKEGTTLNIKENIEKYTPISDLEPQSEPLTKSGDTQTITPIIKKTIEYSNLVIFADEGAEIFVEGVFKGRTKLEIKLSFGEHEISATKNNITCKEVVNIPVQKILTFDIKECH